jgi:hypothetical protein
MRPVLVIAGNGPAARHEWTAREGSPGASDGDQRHPSHVGIVSRSNLHALGQPVWPRSRCNDDQRNMFVVSRIPAYDIGLLGRTEGFDRRRCIGFDPGFRRPHSRAGTSLCANALAIRKCNDPRGVIDTLRRCGRSQSQNQAHQHQRCMASPVAIAGVKPGNGYRLRQTPSRRHGSPRAGSPRPFAPRLLIRISANRTSASQPARQIFCHTRCRRSQGAAMAGILIECGRRANVAAAGRACPSSA